MTTLENSKKLQKIVCKKYGKEMSEKESKELLQKLSSIYKLIYS
jgi:hypothetical protein